jgi:multicomponent Na+:H+ antiporter subunit E
MPPPLPDDQRSAAGRNAATRVAADGDIDVTVKRPEPPLASRRSRAGTAVTRAAALFGLWLVLDQSAKPGDLAVGMMATIGATWLSLRLLPVEAGHVRLLALAALLPRFLWLSLRAGLDVAWRAFAPSAPLRTGFIDYRTGFPPGHARNNFATITSLMPGTVPSGDGPDTIEFHCLDTTQPIAAQMAEEERLLAKALVAGPRHV